MQSSAVGITEGTQTTNQRQESKLSDETHFRKIISRSFNRLLLHQCFVPNNGENLGF